MEKIIKIDGKEIPLKSNARNLTIYRDEFHEDYFMASKMVQEMFVPRKDKEGRIIKENGKPIIDVDSSKLDSLRLARLIWTMAKTADKEIAGFEDWLDSLDSFPILKAFEDAGEMIASNLMTITDVKNAGAAEN